MAGGQHSVTAETRKASSGSAGSGPIAAGAETSLPAMLRRHDRDRYQTVLFAPPQRRGALFALFAFNYEIARVREVVTQPMLGQIRLQWWREVIDAVYAGAATRQHIVALPLTAAIREHGLSRRHFDRLIDTRERDLDDDPPADMPALGDYAEGTSAALQLLVLEILGIGDAASRAAASDIGTAYALAGVLRAMPFHAATGRRLVPAAFTLDDNDYRHLRGTDSVRRAARDIAAAAEARLSAARTQPNLPRAARPALLPGLIVSRYLRRLRQAEYDPFAPTLLQPDTLQSWRLAAAALTGRL